MATCRPGDVLTDGNADTFADWLTAYQGTTVVPRSRRHVLRRGAHGRPTQSRSATADSCGTTWPKPWGKPLPPITVIAASRLQTFPNGTELNAAEDSRRTAEQA